MRGYWLNLQENKMESVSRWPLLQKAFFRFGRPVVVVDLETTGGNLYQDRVTEVALLRFDGQSVCRHEWLVNPCKPIPEFVAQLTGISNEMVRTAPLFAEIALQLLPLLRGAVVVAHNSRFDYTFLRHEFRRAGIDFAAPALCTVQLSRRLYPEFYKHNLDSIIERNAISVENRHRAMTDVLALSDYLEHSLREKNTEDWDNYCRSLMNPKMLPNWVTDALAAQLYALPDSEGVLVWFDAFGKAQAVVALEKAYSETAEMLHGKKVPLYLKAAASVRFIPALGSLHSVWLKAQAMREYGIRPSERVVSKPTAFSTVRFSPDEHGVLQARIVPLDNGSRAVRPYGLFIHKKAAKRALDSWALENRLCPDALNILPVANGKGVPCPVQALGQCDGACRTEDGIEAQNGRVRELAHLLPVADWGRAHEVEITETDGLSGKSITLRCAGGAIAMPDGGWYFDDSLPALLKMKFRRERESVKIIA